MLEHCKFKALTSFSVLFSSAGFFYGYLFSLTAFHPRITQHSPFLSLSSIHIPFSFSKAFALLLFLGGLPYYFSHLSLKVTGSFREFPGSLVVRTLHIHCGGPGLISG